MTLPPVTPPTDDRLHLNPVTMTTTAQPTSTHSSEPHPLATAASMNASSLSSTAPGLLASNIFSTSEVARVKEKPQDVNQPVSKGFTTGWVGGASRKIKEKKYSMHEGNKDDEQIVRFDVCENFIDVDFYRIRWKCQRPYLFSYHRVASYRPLHLLLPSCRRRYIYVVLVCAHAHTHTHTRVFL